MIIATIAAPGTITAEGITLTHKTPVLALCRALIADKPLPLTAEDDALTVMREGKPAMFASITAAAGLTVSENANSGPRFARWSPFPERQESAPDGLEPSEGPDTPENS